MLIYYVTIIRKSSSSCEQVIGEQSFTVEEGVKIATWRRRQIDSAHKIEWRVSCNATNNRRCRYCNVIGYFSGKITSLPEELRRICTERKFKYFQKTGLHVKPIKIRRRSAPHTNRRRVSSLSSAAATSIGFVSIAIRLHALRFADDVQKMMPMLIMTTISTISGHLPQQTDRQSLQYSLSCVVIIIDLQKALSGKLLRPGIDFLLCGGAEIIRY